MNGFTLSVNKNNDKKNIFELKTFKSKGNTFDKINYEDDKFIIVIEGIILNKKELISHHWLDTLKKLYLEYGETFFKKFRGSFSGFLYDKENDKWIIFTDHIGSKRVYYTKISNECYVFSSKIKEIIKIKKGRNQNIELDINASYMLLSYGYLIDKYTLTKDIFRLQPGNYITIDKGNFYLKKYHIFSNKPNYNISNNEIIEKIEKLFNQAIIRQFEKDKEHKLKHFVGLSGGLDSRITTMVSHKLGYIDQLNFTFSKSNYLDETIPKKIAEDLKHEWIFKSLDNGLFMIDIDETTLLSEGNVNYLGLAHGNSLYKYLDFKNLGIIHTGQLGDVILGTYSSYKSHAKEFNLESGAFSKKLISKIDFSKININYENEEIFKFYLRGFSGMNAGLLALQNYSETMSPFYDVDFMEFALSIPVEKRYNHKIYKQWIKMYHKNSTNYIWEKTGKKPKNSLFSFKLSIKGKKITMRKLLTFLKIIKPPINTKNHMNPFTYWYNNNPDIKSYFNNYFKSNVNLINHNELKKDVYYLFNTGNIIEKALVLSLLSYLKVIHNDE